MANKTTDLQKLRNTFDFLGISYDIDRFEKNQKLKEHSTLNPIIIEYNSILKIRYGIGYGNFYTEFYFIDEKYVNYGAWE